MNSMVQCPACKIMLKLVSTNSPVENMWALCVNCGSILFVKTEKNIIEVPYEIAPESVQEFRDNIKELLRTVDKIEKASDN